MIKLKNMIKYGLICFCTYVSVGCNASSTSSNITDTLTTPGPDSMPLFKSPVTDSSGTLTTPPVNVDINIIPDSLP